MLFLIYLQSDDSFFDAIFCFTSSTAILIACSASKLQCSFTGGNAKCSAISVFLIWVAWSSVFPLTHSVAKLLLAMALPHPKHYPL